MQQSLLHWQILSITPIKNATKIPTKTGHKVISDIVHITAKIAAIIITSTIIPNNPYFIMNSFNSFWPI